jgi:hypothetical protein
MRKLPVLEELRVASPCTVPWSSMTGDDQVRHCHTCKQNVYNFSALTRAQAEELIAANQGQMCMRYFHRADGTILLRDCAVEYRPTGLVVAAFATAAAIAATVAYRAHVAHPADRLPAPTVEIPLIHKAEPLPPRPPEQAIFVTGGAAATTTYVTEHRGKPTNHR